MDVNYTPLDVSSFQKKKETSIAPPHTSLDINIIFLSLIIITLGVIAVLIFFVIEKQLRELGLNGSFV